MYADSSLKKNIFHFCLMVTKPRRLKFIFHFLSFYFSVDFLFCPKSRTTGDSFLRTVWPFAYISGTEKKIYIFHKKKNSEILTTQKKKKC